MFRLPKLEYSYDALEPYIDAKTMEVHYSKHHQAYVDKLNAALKGNDDLLALPIKDLLRNLDKVPVGKKDAVKNNGGGHVNHSMFWRTMKPQSRGTPRGNLAQGINEAFGDFEKFKEEFNEAALTQFGSGWAWLVMNKSGRLETISTSNQDSPYMHDYTPILNLDVWEHAYYLKYQNRRADYVEAWWQVVNWNQAEMNYQN